MFFKLEAFMPEWVLKAFYLAVKQCFKYFLDKISYDNQLFRNKNLSTFPSIKLKEK